MKVLTLAVLLLFSLGCTSSVEQVKNSVNDYYYFSNRFQEACPSYDSAQCPELKDKAELLKRWNKQIKEASEAVQRGGKLPLQLKALKETEKAIKAVK